MAYIGNIPAEAYTSFDKQTITGDGGASYTLDHAVANVNEIEVFVNNVRQEPSVAYTVSGTALTMTGNVAASDDFYVVFQGKAIQTVVPPDDSVTTARINDDAVTTAKIADEAVTKAKLGAGMIINYQRNHVDITSTQTISATSYTDVTNSSFTYTPIRSDSKLVITHDVNFRILAPSGQDGGGALRPHIAGSAGDEYEYLSDNLGKLGDTVWLPIHASISQEHTCTSTNAITIKLQGKALSSGRNIQFGSQTFINCVVLEIAQ